MMLPRLIGRRRRPRLGRAQLAVLLEAASEVAGACPWLACRPVDRRTVRSLHRRNLVTMNDSENLFAITPLGCLRLRRHGRAEASEAVAGLRREQRAGSVMPWHIPQVAYIWPSLCLLKERGLPPFDRQPTAASFV